MIKIKLSQLRNLKDLLPEYAAQGFGRIDSRRGEFDALNGAGIGGADHRLELPMVRCLQWQMFEQMIDIRVDAGRTITCLLR